MVDIVPIPRRSFLIGGALALLPALARAQAWPTHSVALIIPFPAGGAMDLLGRGVAQDLAEKLGQPFVVDNRVGAAGNIGAMAAAKAPPDGYTILMAGASSLALNKFMFATMPYDPEQELTPITIVSKLPHVFVANPKVEASTLKELVDYAKANPGKLNAGVPGAGTTAHVTLEAFMAQTGAKMTVVTYRAEPQMLTDLVGGQLDVACTLTTSPGPHVQAGRLRALAVTSAKRAEQVPEIPTIMESGIPDFEVTVWQGYAMPKGTAKAHLANIHAAMMKALASPELKKRFFDNGVAAAPQTPDEFVKFINVERAKWKKAVALSGAKVE